MALSVFLYHYELASGSQWVKQKLGCMASNGVRLFPWVSSFSHGHWDLRVASALGCHYSSMILERFGCSFKSFHHTMWHWKANGMISHLKSYRLPFSEKAPTSAIYVFWSSQVQQTVHILLILLYMFFSTSLQSTIYLHLDCRQPHIDATFWN